MKGGERMKINKRGLSDVVTVSLIILLAIAAVVIVWGFVKPSIESTGKQLSGSNCIQAELVVKSCKANGEVQVQNVGSIAVDKINAYTQTSPTSAGIPFDCGAAIAQETKNCVTGKAATTQAYAASVIGGKTCPATAPVTCI